VLSIIPPPDYRPDPQRLAVLEARATADDLREYQAKPTVTSTPNPLCRSLRKRTGRPPKPVHSDLPDDRYGSASDAAWAYHVDGSKIAEAARSQGVKRVAGRLWFYEA
jgi:hypothetical protein